MAMMILSGSWALIFLVLAMWAVIFGVPIAYLVWAVKKRKSK